MYLKSPDEMAQTFFVVRPRRSRATLEIAERCSGLKLKLGEPMLPSFKVPEGYDTEGYFRHVAREGLERRFEDLEAAGQDRRPRRVPQAPRDRARRHREDEVPRLLPHRLGLHPPREGERHPRRPGARLGRGIARRVRDADHRPRSHPVQPALRALPEPGARVSMPDFDIDFCMDRRDEVIAYVQQKYGETSVGQIATFAELKAKSVDQGRRALHRRSPRSRRSRSRTSSRARPRPRRTRSPRPRASSRSSRRAYETDPRVRELLDQAQKLEGLTRHAGKHAAGIVISEGPLWDHVPVFKDEKSGALRHPVLQGRRRAGGARQVRLPRPEDADGPRHRGAPHQRDGRTSQRDEDASSTLAPSRWTTSRPSSSSPRARRRASSSSSRAACSSSSRT